MSYLKSSNQLKNTYVIFTSDHGYHLGQFGLIKGKNMPYEFDIKVPFFIRGPGIFKRTMYNFSVFKFFFFKKLFRSTNIVSNIDIAPTIIDMAGLKVSQTMNGRSVLDLIYLEEGI